MNLRYAPCLIQHPTFSLIYKNFALSYIHRTLVISNILSYQNNLTLNAMTWEWSKLSFRTERHIALSAFDISNLLYV